MVSGGRPAMKIETREDEEEIVHELGLYYRQMAKEVFVLSTRECTDHRVRSDTQKIIMLDNDIKPRAVPGTMYFFNTRVGHAASSYDNALLNERSDG